MPNSLLVHKKIVQTAKFGSNKGQSTLRSQELPGANLYFFYCVQELPCQAMHSAELPDAMKQAKNCPRLFLAHPQCRLAFNMMLKDIKYIL